MKPERLCPCGNPATRASEFPGWDGDLMLVFRCAEHAPSDFDGINNDYHAGDGL